MMNNYSARRRNELLIHTTIWVSLKRVMLNGKKPIPKYYKLNDPIYIML